MSVIRNMLEVINLLEECRSLPYKNQSDKTQTMPAYDERVTAITYTYKDNDKDDDSQPADVISVRLASRSGAERAVILHSETVGSSTVYEVLMNVPVVDVEVIPVESPQHPTYESPFHEPYHFQPESTLAPRYVGSKRVRTTVTVMVEDLDDGTVSTEHVELEPAELRAISRAL